MPSLESPLLGAVLIAQLTTLTDIDVGGKAVIGPHVIDTAEPALTLGYAVTLSHTHPTGAALTTVTGMSHRVGAASHTLTDIDVGGKAVIGTDVVDTAESALTLGVSVTVSQTHPTGTALSTVTGISQGQGAADPAGVL